MSKLVAGNWKMFGNKAMIADIKKIDQYCKEKTCEVAICPPFPLISDAHEQTKNIKIGAQNCHININGAHTGEVSTKDNRRMCTAFRVERKFSKGIKTRGIAKYALNGHCWHRKNHSRKSFVQ